ncbi:MAG: hypothetical protein QM804_11235 [Propionicimonas sp.]
MNRPEPPADPGYVRQLSWHGEPAVEVRGDAASLVVSPARGGKIVSLRDRTGREWLAQPAADCPLPPPAEPGAVFTDAELCGWDECAPSIVACPVAGAELPDHGELWTRRWWAQGGAAGVWAPSFGYRFSRRIEPIPDGFALHYEVAATDRSFPFLWAAHPQFLAPPGSEVVVDAGEVVWDVLPEPAEQLAWEPGLARLDTLPPGGCRKFYLPPERPVSAAELRLADGHRLRFGWDERVLPYLGVWFDACRYSRENVVALEPSTAFYDSLERAVAFGRVPTVHPGSPLTWTLSVTFA